MLSLSIRDISDNRKGYVLKILYQANVWSFSWNKDLDTLWSEESNYGSA